MSLADLDAAFTNPKRLAIAAMLAAAEWVESAYLRERLDLSASDLSKQCAALESAGHLTVKKTGGGPTGRTWYRVTKPGRRAYDSHVAALRELVAAVPSESVADPDALV